MDSLGFHQAGMKKCQARNEEMQADYYRKQCMRNSDFRYGIAKISQGLQKFRNGSENFAVLEKFSLCHIFAMIANSLCHIFAMIAKFRYHSESYNA